MQAAVGMPWMMRVKMTRMVLGLSLVQVPGLGVAAALRVLPWRLGSANREMDGALRAA